MSRRVLSTEAFAAFLNSAIPGERFTYFTGHLAHARQNADVFDDAAEINAVAELAFREARAKRILLVQQRRGEKFEYIAVRAFPSKSGALA